jgi:hypothetical protein
VAKSEVTQPQPFHFRSDARLRGPTPAAREAAEEEERHQQQRLQREREKAAKAAAGGPAKELVVPKPFQLATERRGQVHKVRGRMHGRGEGWVGGRDGGMREGEGLMEAVTPG